MFPSNCKAILKTLDDNIIEYGQATVSLKDKFAEFSAQFVPLLKIATEAKIICMEGAVSTHIILSLIHI